MGTSGKIARVGGTSGRRGNSNTTTDRLTWLWWETEVRSANWCRVYKFPRRKENGIACFCRQNGEFGDPCVCAAKTCPFVMEPIPGSDPESYLKIILKSRAWSRIGISPTRYLCRTDPSRARLLSGPSPPLTTMSCCPR